MRRVLYSAILALFFSFFANAQWTDDATLNTIVNDMSGEQAVPHIAYDANGNFYVGFYSNNAGNYDIRLQYYNYSGIAQWANNGILISDHTQNSWVTEWDLTTDNSGNCVMAFNDVRDGNANVYAYSISSSGTFNWGADGIALTSSTEDEYVPSITVTSTNDIIVAWSRPTATQNEIVMQKITQAGVLSWGTAGITYQTGSESYTGARVLGVDNGDYLMAFYKETGSFPSLTRSIYVQKFDDTGTAVWTSDVLASNSNGINNFNNFYIASDGSNGIVISWTDDRDSDLNIDGAVQRVENDGTINWPANGVEVNTTGSTSNQDVRILGVDNSGNVLVTWSKKNSNQSQTAIAGQKINPSGVRQWTDDGIEFVSMSADIASSDGGVVYDGTNAMIIYEEYVSGSSLYTHVKALAVDSTGTLVWSPTSTLMASRTTEKVHLTVSGIYNDQVIAVWEEGNPKDIYMQNIYNDGSMGDPPISDDATLSDLTVNGVTVDGFSPAIYYYSVPIPAGDPVPVTGATANHPAATVAITQATSVPDSATVLVTAEDGITQLTYIVNYTIAGTDATLSDLTVNGTTIAGFDPDTLNYDYTVPQGDPIPVVGATPTDPNADVEITQATSLPGTAIVDVTAEDGTTQLTYTVNFLYTPSSDATLIDLLVDNQSIPDFNPDTLNYTYGVVFDNPAPTIDGIPNDPLATTSLTQAVSVPGDGVIVVTAEDGITTLTYTVSFYYLDYDASLSDLTVDGITIPDFDPETFYYDYLVENTDTIPQVDGTTTDPDAYLTISQATSIPGNAVLNVLAEDSVHESTYTVHFYAINGDATLSDLTVDGTTIPGFDPSIIYYEYDVFVGEDIPFVDGTPNDSLATKQLTQANEIPGDAFVLVTAQDSITQMNYQVHFNLITSLDQLNEENITLYPNPVEGEFKLSGIHEIVELKIVGLLGEEVYSNKGFNGETIDTKSFKQGIYFVQILFRGGKTQTIKFIKN
ncbi:MAG: T9SS type A sorting domain-containing protein [Chlorobi bacterium]|nr:T9SS type A sorting domain-containing protein [Chlorobiota bacterium]